MRKLERYLRDQIELFSREAPQREFEQGYLAALTATAVEGLGIPFDDPLIAKARRRVPDTFLLPRAGE